jgi:hypothetical protein
VKVFDVYVNFFARLDVGDGLREDVSPTFATGGEKTLFSASAAA